MPSEPMPSSLRGTCPCCGTPDCVLRVCPRCDWKAAPADLLAGAKQRLHEFQTGLGFSAYNPRGCSVCEACWSQMGGNGLACPLRIFHEAGLTPEQGSLRPGRQYGVAISARWAAWLAERDWPEQTEIHWRRLVDHLDSEREREQEQA